MRNAVERVSEEHASEQLWSLELASEEHASERVKPLSELELLTNERCKACASDRVRPLSEFELLNE